MMKTLMIAVLVSLIVVLQYKLWFSDGGLGDVRRLNKTIALQQKENAELSEKNHLLAAEVENLKRGDDAIEERARTELGLIKEVETFYQIVK